MPDIRSTALRRFRQAPDARRSMVFPTSASQQPGQAHSWRPCDAASMCTRARLHAQAPPAAPAHSARATLPAVSASGDERPILVAPHFPPPHMRRAFAEPAIPDHTPCSRPSCSPASPSSRSLRSCSPPSSCSRSSPRSQLSHGVRIESWKTPRPPSPTGCSSLYSCGRACARPSSLVMRE